MSLGATHVGQAVDPGGLEGRVHSVFDRACNLALRGGGFATLTGRDVPMAPRAIRLKTANEFRFSEVLAPGLSFACRGGVLRFAGTDFAVDLRGAETVDCTLPGVSGRSGEDVRARWHAAWDALSGLEPLRRVMRLAPFGLLDEVNWRPAVRSLIGVGPGLTPAGDDILVGFAAGMAMAGCGLDDLRAAIGDNAHRTTDLSAAMLRDAGAGLFFEPVIGFAVAIMFGGDVRGALARLARVGDTSGTAAALGLLIGVAAGDPVLGGATVGLDTAA